MHVLYPGFAGGDRTDLKLPETQSEMLRALNDTGTPIVLALTAGSALAVNWAKENLDAIIYLWYSGESKKISFELTQKDLSIINDELTYPVDNSNSIV